MNRQRVNASKVNTVEVNTVEGSIPGTIMQRGAAITGWGTSLPDKVVTNTDFASRLETSDAWITERTGIKERRMGGSTSELATAAGRAAMESAGLTGADIDLLLVATSTPDQIFPATSAAVSENLGLKCGSFDLNAACAGFVYALTVANGLVLNGLDRILLIGADTMSRAVDQDDRTTAVLFGDGAGAVVLEAVPGEGNLLAFDAGTDGASRSILFADHGGHLQMDGKEVFRRAVRMTVESALAAVEKAKVTVDQIALFVPHQANVRIISAVADRIGIPLDRCAIVVERTGNTSAASIPLALAEAADDGRLTPGDLVLMSGFGAGMTWASVVWRWGQK